MEWVKGGEYFFFRENIMHTYILSVFTHRHLYLLTLDRKLLQNGERWRFDVPREEGKLGW